MSENSCLDYGNLYWVVEVPEYVSADKYLSVFADSVVISPSGDLMFSNHSRNPKSQKEQFFGLILAKGQWYNCYAANVLFGDPITVDTWNAPDEKRAGKQSRWTHPERKIAPKLRHEVLERDKYTCVKCGRSPDKDGVSIHVDHILPISQGGKSEAKNLQVLCSDCNLGKSAQIERTQHRLQRTGGGVAPTQADSAPSAFSTPAPSPAKSTARR